MSIKIDKWNPNGRTDPRVLLMPIGAAKLEADEKSKQILMKTNSLPESKVCLELLYPLGIKTHGSSSGGRRTDGDAWPQQMDLYTVQQNLSDQVSQHRKGGQTEAAVPDR